MKLLNLISALIMCLGWLEFSQAQELSVLVKINTNDCVNCVAGGQAIREIDPLLKPRFVFRSEEAKLGSALLEQHFEFKPTTEAIIANDSLFYALSKTRTGSTVFLFEGEKILRQVPLELFSGQVGLFNNYAQTFYRIDSLLLPKDFAHSKRCYIEHTSKGLYVHDYVLKSVYFLPLLNSHFDSAQSLDLSREFMMSQVPELKISEKEASLIKQIGQDKPRIGPLSRRGDTLEFFCAYTQPQWVGRNMELDYQVLLLQYTGASFLKAWRINVQPIGDYSMNGTLQPHTSYSGVYVPVMKEKRSNSLGLYAAYSFHPDVDSLVFDSILMFELPKDLQSTSAYEDFSASYFSGSYLFFGYSRFLYHNQRKRFVELPFKQHNKFGKSPKIQHQLLYLEQEKQMPKGTLVSIYFKAGDGQFYQGFWQEGEKDWLLQRRLPNPYSNLRAYSNRVLYLGNGCVYSVYKNKVF